MIIAKDLMTHHPWVIYTSDSVQQAADIFTKNKPSTIPVLVPTGEVHGVISEIPLLKLYVKLKAVSQLDRQLIEFAELFETPKFVREWDSIATVMQATLKSSHHRVLVLDDNKHLRGVISPKDLLSMLNGVSSQSVSMQKELIDLRSRVAQMQATKSKLEQTQGDLKNYELVIAGSSFMFHSVDAQGKILIANERIHKVLGYQPGELVGKTIYDLYPKELWPVVEKGLAQVRAEGHTQINTSYLAKNGDLVKVELGSHAIVDAQGNFIATSTLARMVDGDSLLRLLNGVIK